MMNKNRFIVYDEPENRRTIIHDTLNVYPDEYISDEVGAYIGPLIVNNTCDNNHDAVIKNNAKIEQIIQDLMYEYNRNYEFQLKYFDKSFNKARTLKNMRYWEAGINALIHLLTRLKEENILQDD